MTPTYLEFRKPLDAESEAIVERLVTMYRDTGWTAMTFTTDTTVTVRLFGKHTQPENEKECLS